MLSSLSTGSETLEQHKGIVLDEKLQFHAVWLGVRPLPWHIPLYILQRAIHQYFPSKSFSQIFAKSTGLFILSPALNTGQYSVKLWSCSAVSAFKI